MGSAMLHILNKPTHSEPAEQMLLTVAAGDSILLIEDAVQALLHVNWRGWHLENDIHVFILEEDAISRGVYPASPRSSRSMAGYERVCCVDRAAYEDFIVVLTNERYKFIPLS